MSRSVAVFCSIEGCARSRRPEGGKKGRGFGAREDKMREHVRTVHGRKHNKTMGEGGGDCVSDEKQWEEEGSEGDGSGE
jgi:hypothetical protein